jgi:hypothetical protein
LGKACSATLAHFVLEERLHVLGIVGCVLCIVGSINIVLYAPQERAIVSVKDVWLLATESAFLLYVTAVAVSVLLLIFYYVPRYGHTHILIYLGICSLMGSLSVPSMFVLNFSHSKNEPSSLSAASYAWYCLQFFQNNSILL